jgi:hypothetical protein
MNATIEAVHDVFLRYFWAKPSSAALVFAAVGFFATILLSLRMGRAVYSSLPMKNQVPERSVEAAASTAEAAATIAGTLFVTNVLLGGIFGVLLFVAMR